MNETNQSQTMNVAFRTAEEARSVRPDSILATTLNEAGLVSLVLTMVTNEVVYSREEVSVTQTPQGLMPNGEPRYHGEQRRVNEGSVKLTPVTALQIKAHVDAYLQSLPPELQQAIGLAGPEGAPQAPGA